MTSESERPAFTHRPARHGLIGPFSGRQLLAGAIAVLMIAIVGVVVTTPLGNTANQPDLIDPLATPFIIGEAPAEGLQAGQQAPEMTIDLGDGSTYQLKDLDGNPVRLADLRGKVVFLNFWATWCEPCREEMPSMERLHRAYKDRGLVVLAISLDAQGASVVNPFVKKFAITFPIGLDPKMAVRETYGVWAVPSTFLIDKQGKRVLFANGAREWDGKAAHAVIESLLK